VLTRPPPRTAEDAPRIAHRHVQHHDVAGAIALAPDLCTRVRAPQADRFDDWLARAMARGVAARRRFATGRQVDDAAVQASLRLLWSHGPVDGPLHRFSRLQRSPVGAPSSTG
jgi:hypothetical protein